MMPTTELAIVRALVAKRATGVDDEVTIESFLADDGLARLVAEVDERGDEVTRLRYQRDRARHERDSAENHAATREARAAESMRSAILSEIDRRGLLTVGLDSAIRSVRIPLEGT